MNRNNEEVVGTIFRSIPGLRDWILTTKLWRALLEYSGRPEVAIIGFEMMDDMEMAGNIVMQLSDQRVETPDDLPHEVVLQFFKNSPMYNKENVDNLIKNAVSGLEEKIKIARQSILN